MNKSNFREIKFNSKFYIIQRRYKDDTREIFENCYKLNNLSNIYFIKLSKS